MLISDFLSIIGIFLFLVSSLFTITTKNTVFSVLFLILNFTIAAGLLFLLNCDFMALIFLIVYVGAIAVLFLFIIMMLNIKILNSVKDLLKYTPIGVGLCTIILIESFLIIVKTFSTNYYFKIPNNISELNFICVYNDNVFLTNQYSNWYIKIDTAFSINDIGQVLYTYYLIDFLISGTILLLAVVGATVLTSNYSFMGNRRQFFFKQITRQSSSITLN